MLTRHASPFRTTVAALRGRAEGEDCPVPARTSCALVLPAFLERSPPAGPRARAGGRPRTHALPRCFYGLVHHPCRGAGPAALPAGSPSPRDGRSPSPTPRPARVRDQRTHLTARRGLVRRRRADAATRGARTDERPDHTPGRGRRRRHHGHARIRFPFPPPAAGAAPSSGRGRRAERPPARRRPGRVWWSGGVALGHGRNQP